MLKLKPHFVYDDKDKKIGVVLDIDEFEKIIDELEDYQDYQLVKERSEKKEKWYTLEEVMEKTKKRLRK